MRRSPTTKVVVVIAVFRLVLTGLSQAQAASIGTDLTNPVDVPGIAGFQTTGAMMSGMTVTATFSNNFSQTLAWGTTGATTGGVVGANWSLIAIGDTFATNAWTFSHSSNAMLTGLSLNGAPGVTVFDRTFGGAFGTEGTASGRDFRTTLAGDALIVGTYRNPVGVAGAPPVEDIFHVLDVNFGGIAGGGVASGVFSFTQDTDNNIRPTPVVPEPSSLLLLGSGLFGSAAMRFLKRKSEILTPS